MLKSMGKKKLLTLVAVMAVAVTVLGSFAAWDVLTGTSKSDSVSLRNPVTVTAENFTLTKTDEALDVAPKIDGSAKFTLDGYDKTKMDFQVVKTDDVVIKNASGTPVTEFFNILEPTIEVDASGANATVKVEATVLDSQEAKAAVKDQQVSIEVTGHVIKKAGI